MDCRLGPAMGRHRAPKGMGEERATTYHQAYRGGGVHVLTPEGLPCGRAWGQHNVATKD
jgi:hypothetical protein